MNKAELIKALAELLAEKMELGEEPTNGEVLQALFPNETMIEQTGMCTYYRNMRFNTEWWNAPYQKGGE